MIVIGCVSDSYFFAQKMYFKSFLIIENCDPFFESVEDFVMHFQMLDGKVVRAKGCTTMLTFVNFEV